MNKSANFIVIALAVTCLVVAVKMSGSQQSARESFKPLRPFAKVDVDNVEQIRIDGGPEAFILKKIDKKTWGLASRGDYPVDADRLRRTVYGLTQLEAVDRLTADPAKYDQLGVGKEADKGSIELLGEGKKPLATLIVGKDRSTGSGDEGSREGSYVRVDDNPNVFISSKTISIDIAPAIWLQRDVIKVDEANLQRVRIDNSATTQSIELAREKADPFKLLTKIPKGREANAGALSSVPRALAQFTLSDVLAADALGTRTLTREASYRATQKNGLVYKAEASAMDGKHYIQLAAEYDKAADLSLSDARTSDTLAAKALPAAEAEVKKINETHSKWIYEAPEYAYENFAKKLDDVTQPIPTPTPEPTPEAATKENEG